MNQVPGSEKELIKELVHDLITYARAQGITAEFWVHAEHSTLVRLANSAISLNTSEDLCQVTVTACRGNARGTCSVMAPPNERERLYAAVHTADEIARHATPTTYPRTLKPIAPLPDDDAGFDPPLHQLTADQKLAYLEAAVVGVESPQERIAGMLSSGAVWEAAGNTLSDTVVFHALTDAAVALVVSHTDARWELQSTQSATSVSELQPPRVREELSLLLAQYHAAPAQPLPLGRYDVIFGREAIAELLMMCCWLGFNGGNCRRRRTFLTENDLGKQVFSEAVNIVDDPTQRATFPYAFDVHGVARKPFPFVSRGVFTAFFWDRDSADEFGQAETGHSVPAFSLTLAPGTAPVRTLAELLAMPRDRDLLYIPTLHYMNVVHETEGIITCCSRFGALLLCRDGRLIVPYNVRMTEKLSHIFGNIAWLSREQVAVNVSSTYGLRTPTACLVPSFICVGGVSITHANTSF